MSVTRRKPRDMTVADWWSQPVEYITDYEGCVLAIGARSVQIMSDIWGTEYYAIVWDETEGKRKHISLDTYEYARDVNVSGEVDYTPEVLEKYRAWRINRVAERLRQKDMTQAERVAEGRVVFVKSGRTGKGATGKVFKRMLGIYNSGSYRAREEYKLGIALSDEMEERLGKYGRVFQSYKDVAWVWERNVEVVNPEMYLTYKEEDIIKGATETVNQEIVANRFNLND